jgi:CheY-like chemotaxis protein
MQESLRILIVDDEPATRLVMERALAQVGYVSTVEANSAEAARRVLAGATDIGAEVTDAQGPAPALAASVPDDDWTTV